MNEKMENRFGLRLLFGFLIVLAGVLMLLERLDLGVNISFHTYWPTLLIFLGIGKMVWPAYRRQIFFGLVLVVVGGLFQLRNLGYIFFHAHDLWPLLIILVGLSIICRNIWGTRFRCTYDIRNHLGRDGSRHGMFSGDKGVITTDHLDISVVFGGGEYKLSSQQFKGGDVSATFGGIELDLREAVMEGDSVVLNVSTSFGSVEIRVPSQWTVQLDGSPTLGSIENKTMSPQNATKKLIVKGTATFGSIEVGN